MTPEDPRLTAAQAAPLGSAANPDDPRTCNVKITKPGVYSIPVEEYFSDPAPTESLSQSGAKMLLPPNAPAHYRWYRDNPPETTETTETFRFGHAAHRVVLGDGPELFRLEHTDMRTKAAKEERAEIEDAGGIALLPDKFDAVVAMAKAIKVHPVASKLFDPAGGKPEQSLFWQANEVWRRGRLDWLPNPRPNGRLVVPDYKTAESAHEDKFQRSMDSYGYHMQAAWYLDGVKALLGADDVSFVFVVQEKNPPYLVNVIEPDPTAVKIGRYLNRKAVELFEQCQRTGKWPGYPANIERVRLPYWTEAQFEGVLTSWL